jgi:uncharacterized membrane protein
MSPESLRNTNLGVGVGFLLQLAGFFLAQTRGTTAILGLVLILMSIPALVWGCMNYAEGKGHPKTVGLVGIAGLIGLIALIVLPQRDGEGSVRRLQLRKLVGSISLLLGVVVVIFGRWLDDLEYGSISSRSDVLLEHPWPGVFMLLGVCLVGVSLVLLLGGDRR